MIKLVIHKMKRAFYWLSHPLLFYVHLCEHGHFKWIPDKPYIKILYRLYFHEKMNLDNPKGYNEKLNWIKLYDRKPEYKSFVDKIEVRKIVSEKIGEKYLIPAIQVCDTPNQIDWSTLPSRFVLKCSHGSHCNIICKDKTQLDIQDSIRKISKWQKKSWFWFAREWPYKDLKPRILIEEYMQQSDFDILVDYKVMCFDGIPKIIEVHKNRGLPTHTQDFYDIHWNNLRIKQGDVDISSGDPKPILFEEMINLSRILSEGMIHIRVDWYIINGKLYFGELTFFDGSGFCEFDNKDDDLLLGSYINIPLNKISR